ncbi:MAG: hypothetical protein CMF57_08410 [Leifsonia sp.]|jgi:excisionase family DNA binding protein|nr:hypothetical protein [Leifsonia sp.]
MFAYCLRCGYSAHMEPQQTFLTIDEYAALVRVNPATVRRLISEGELEGIRIGTQYRLVPPTPGRLEPRKSA